MALRHEKEYYYSPIPWRHSSLRANVFGLDPLVLLIIPLSFLTLAREWPTWFFGIYFLFFAAVVYSKFRGYETVLEWAASLRTRAQGVQWPVR